MGEAVRFGVRRAVALLALVSVTLLAAASTAAACGTGRYASARNVPAGVGRAPLAIGDSTMILAAPYLGRLGIEANAKGCRQFSAGVEMLAARRRAGTLPAVSILALGANGAIGPGQIRRALRVIGRSRILALVTPRNQGTSRARMWAAVRSYPSRVVMIDWTSHSAGRGGWFAGDGLHVGYSGAAAYARLIRRRIAPYAFPPVRRLKLPRRTRGAKACGTVRQGRVRLRVYVVRGRSRVLCRGARALVRRPPLRLRGGWRSYDWRRVKRSSWQWVYRRRDGRAVVGTVRARARSTRIGARPAQSETEVLAFNTFIKWVIAAGRATYIEDSFRARCRRLRAARVPTARCRVSWTAQDARWSGSLSLRGAVRFMRRPPPTIFRYRFRMTERRDDGTVRRHRWSGRVPNVPA
jgi:hypothetical protein